ncbi:hypothetical protein [Azospirillum sp. sgz302134]
MEDRITFIEQYDLGFLTARLVKRGMPIDAAAASVADFRALVTMLARHPDTPFAAWGRVEDALHEFILDTARYRAFCSAAVGRFIDHDPSAFGTDAFRAAWGNSVRILGDEFGIALNPDPDAGEGDASGAAMCMVTMSAAMCMVTLAAA